ncbi:zinc finger CCCH domain-containing protein 3 [Ochotona princeps]|uniref:zinc finger CCCH domain-containing protein 3 n=1 Tax=Ochotona princeps TaxID=9978 RepID=UPI00271550CD|nr:zinc finger CCCH domain-containing protein 3 [Ochotona princeps]
MMSRGPGRASRIREMDEKEQLRRQIRLLQGLIDDYKNLHGSTPGPSAASRWPPPPAYAGDRTFGGRCCRPGRRDFSRHGPSWRKKYSLVNWPPGPSEPPGDRAGQTAPAARAAGQEPEDAGAREDVLERQVRLGSDQSMVIRIRSPSKAGSATATGLPEDAPWGDRRPQGGEGEPSRPGSTSCSVEDPLLVCQKEPGRPRTVRAVGSARGSPPGPRRTVSEGALRAHLPAAATLGRKVGPHSAASCDGRVRTSHPDQPVPVDPTPAAGQARQAPLLAAALSSKFRRNNYKWVAASAKSPRAARRTLSPRAAAENVGKGLGAVAGHDKPRKPPTTASKPGPSPSKYKWMASSSSCSSSGWQAEAGSRDPCRPPSPAQAGGPKPVLGESPLSAYKLKSRTKIIRRRGSASLPGDKKNSLSPASTSRSQPSLRRRQATRGKSSPVLKKTPGKGLLQVTRHRLCRLLPSRAHLPAKEACSLHPLRTPPSGKVIKTRYRIVKKTPTAPLSVPPLPLSLPSWRARRLSQSRSLVLNRLCPAAAGSARWGSKGYCSIGGVLYKVSANKLSKTSGRPGGAGGRPGDAGGRPLLRTGRVDAPSSCSRSLASRAVQRSLAIIRQARQKKERKKEYCMYYNRFGRCNRGECCPYVHDPEKVAVCTRFVRGTCKKTDGTCPFSHQVSKEKMPVCSYFLKGVCSHSSCPYSHVYVSRKAEVCSDFLKGYCPLGAKCKRKHTLLCPDFARRGACPRGAQCQLLHRARKRHGRRATPPTPGPSEAASKNKRASSPGPRSPAAVAQCKPTPMPASLTAPAPTSPPPSPGKPASPLASTSSLRASSSSPPSSPSSSSHALEQEEPRRLKVATPAALSSGGLCKLPAFISLRSSPSPGGQPRARTPRSSSSRNSGQALHIKPRL